MCKDLYQPLKYAVGQSGLPIEQFGKNLFEYKKSTIFSNETLR